MNLRGAENPPGREGKQKAKRQIDKGIPQQGECQIDHDISCDKRQRGPRDGRLPRNPVSAVKHCPYQKNAPDTGQNQINQNIHACRPLSSAR